MAADRPRRAVTTNSVPNSLPTFTPRVEAEVILLQKWPWEKSANSLPERWMGSAISWNWMVIQRYVQKRFQIRTAETVFMS